MPANYNRINEWPLQLLRTGHYGRSYGYLHGRTTAGYWWSGTAGSAINGRNLNAWIGNVYVQSNYYRGVGFALRGVAAKQLFPIKLLPDGKQRLHRY